MSNSIPAAIRELQSIIHDARIGTDYTRANTNFRRWRTATTPLVREAFGGDSEQKFSLLNAPATIKQNAPKLIAEAITCLHYLQSLSGTNEGGMSRTPLEHQQLGSASVQSQPLPSDGGSIQYDVAISFAGADRSVASAIAGAMRSLGFRIFYDEYEAATLWGKDNYTHLSDVYANKARYCLILVSQSYAKCLWTKLECRAAQSRAFKERSEYILPLRLDDTAIEGILETTGYIDFRQRGVQEVVDLLRAKLVSSSTPPV